MVIQRCPEPIFQVDSLNQVRGEEIQVAQCIFELDSQGSLSITLLTLDKTQEHWVIWSPQLYSKSNVSVGP